MKVVDLFLIPLLAIETSASNNIMNVVKIKGNVYDCWYYMLDIFGSFFVIKVAKLLVVREATAVAM